MPSKGASRVRTRGGKRLSSARGVREAECEKYDGEKEVKGRKGEPEEGLEGCYVEITPTKMATVPDDGRPKPSGSITSPSSSFDAVCPYCHEIRTYDISSLQKTPKIIFQDGLCASPCKKSPKKKRKSIGGGEGTITNPYHICCGRSILYLEKIPGNGDCFYDSIVQSLGHNNPTSPVSVSSLREIVSDRMTETQLDFYRLLDEIDTEREEGWLDFLRKSDDMGKRSGDGAEESQDTHRVTRQRSKETPKPSPVPTQSFHPRPPLVQNLTDLKSYVKLCGSEHGSGGCLWADNFAFSVISNEFNITFLFIDMESTGQNPIEHDSSSWPYRVLSEPEEGATKDGNTKFVVLVREKEGHFNLIKWKMGEGEEFQAVCEKGDLPQVVRKLWRID
jgi:hypothetical protein